MARTILTRKGVARVGGSCACAPSPRDGRRWRFCHRFIAMPLFNRRSPPNREKIMQTVNMSGRDFTVSIEGTQVVVSTPGKAAMQLPLADFNPDDPKFTEAAAERYCHLCGIEPCDSDDDAELEESYWAVDTIAETGSRQQIERFNDPFAKDAAWKFYNELECAPGCSKAILEVVGDVEIEKCRSKPAAPGADPEAEG
jgi:hypothetical protein